MLNGKGSWPRCYRSHTSCEFYVRSPSGWAEMGISSAIITRMDALLALVLFTGFVAVLAGIVFIGRYSRPTPDFAFQPAQGHIFPHRTRAILFSRAERSFYHTLRAVIPDHMIFVKVKLADLVSR